MTDLPLEIFVAGAMFVALTFYALMAGADYGGGVWDLLASGPRADKQRERIAEAIGPIWEANHVWLILAVVLLFSAFPRAYAVLSTYLHIPLTLVLVGIVMRGSAFTFRTYDSREDQVQRRWSLVFSGASLVTPFLLGIIVGSLSAGGLYPHDTFINTYVAPWLGPFQISVGALAVALFAYLAAVYLTVECADDVELQNDFRARALVSWVVLVFIAVATFWFCEQYSPDFGRILLSSWSLPVHGGAMLTAAAAAILLYKRNYVAARLCAVGQVTLILWGWAFAQFPYLIRPDVDIFNAAAPAITLELVLLALGAGGILLFPSFYYLLRVFKSARATSEH